MYLAAKGSSGGVPGVTGHRENHYIHSMVGLLPAWCWTFSLLNPKIPQKTTTPARCSFRLFGFSQIPPKQKGPIGAKNSKRGGGFKGFWVTGKLRAKDQAPVPGSKTRPGRALMVLPVASHTGNPLPSYPLRLRTYQVGLRYNDIRPLLRL